MKKGRLVPLAFLIFINQNLQTQVTQEWIVNYNDSIRFENNQYEYSTDVINSMAIDDNGNAYQTGNCFFDYYWGHDQRIATVKYNSSGNIEWVAGYPQHYSDQYVLPYDILTDSQGNVFIIASKQNGNTFDYLTVEYNSGGNLVWESVYNGQLNYSDIPYSIASDKDGNIYVTGKSLNVSANGYDIVTVKYGSNGSQKWVKIFDGTGHQDDIPVKIKIDKFYNVVVSGYTTSSGNGEDFCTVVYDSSGTQLWVRTINYGGEDFIAEMTLDSTGNIYVTGMISPNSSTREFCTVKYSKQGDQKWLKRYLRGDGYNYNRPFGIDIDKFGNVYVTGFSEKYYLLEDYVTIKYDSSGSEKWRAIYDGTSNSLDIATDIRVDFNNEDCYVTGISTESSLGYTTIKYGSTGVIRWLQRVDSAGHIFELYPIIHLNNTKDVFVGGGRNRYVTRYDFVLTKYHQPIGIQQISYEIPKSFSLYQNYPNPFNPQTKIKFGLPEQTHVKLVLFDVLGREVSALVNELLKAGEYNVTWNASSLSSGIYFYRIETDKFTETRKMVLIK